MQRPHQLCNGNSVSAVRHVCFWTTCCMQHGLGIPGTACRGSSGSAVVDDSTGSPWNRLKGCCCFLGGLPYGPSTCKGGDIQMPAHSDETGVQLMQVHVPAHAWPLQEEAPES